MSSATDVARMLTLVPWMIERPGASLDEAAEAFGVDARTIRRDLDHLAFCGLPGLGGGDLFEVDLIGDRVVVSMADELRRPLRPTPQEALRLVLTVDAVMEVLGDDVPALTSAVAKVRAALGVPARLADVFADEGAPVLAEARRAVQSGRRVRMAYQGRADDAPIERDVDPWQLHVQDGLWYLQGYDCRAQDARSFRLDRAVTLNVLDEPAVTMPPDDLAAPRYRPSGDDLQVVLELDASGWWVADAVDVDEREELADGRLRISLHTDAPAWIARLVLTAGGAARVVEPDTLRDQVAELASQALGRLEDITPGAIA